MNNDNLELKEITALFDSMLAGFAAFIASLLLILFLFGVTPKVVLISLLVSGFVLILVGIITYKCNVVKGSKNLLCLLGRHKFDGKASTYEHTKDGKSYIEGQKCSRCGKTRF